MFRMFNDVVLRTDKILAGRTPGWVVCPSAIFCVLGWIVLWLGLLTYTEFVSITVLSRSALLHSTMIILSAFHSHWSNYSLHSTRFQICYMELLIPGHIPNYMYINYLCRSSLPFFHFFLQYSLNKVIIHHPFSPLN